ncbi:fibronectin type III domain-containing protein [Geodermatophilus siccatus]|nr:fibronectin type III domain-containing protein [Geodermatophilus siccatus]
MSTVVLGAGAAQATPTLEPFAGTVSGDPGGQDTRITVPAGYCAIDWDLRGAQGGASDGTPGGLAGRLQGTTWVREGDQYLLQPGEVGGSADQPTGGRSGSTTSESITFGPVTTGEPGDSGELVRTSGGGGASAVRHGGTAEGLVLMLAYGGDGASSQGWGPLPEGGGRGYNVFGGGTHAAAGEALESEWTAGGAGSIGYEGVPCEYSPEPPVIQHALPTGADAITVRFWAPNDERELDARADVTGYEITLDGGTTWRPITPTRTDQTPALTVTVTGLDQGTYPVAVRATSSIGPSAASTVFPARVVRPLGTPTGVTASVGTSSIRVAFEHPADDSGILGYTASAFPDAEWEDIQDTWPTAGAVWCDAQADENGCLIGVPAGYSYSVVVYARGEDGYIGADTAPIVTEVVPGPQQPAAAPAGDGPLSTEDGRIDQVTPGEEVVLTGSGFLPFSTVVLTMYSTPTPLGTAVVGADGTFTATVTIPSGVAAGTHALVASGIDDSGAPYALRMDVTLTGATAGPAGTSGSTGTTVPTEASTPGSAGSTGSGEAGALAFTGASVVVPGVAGLVTLVAGGALVLLGRRRAAR